MASRSRMLFSSSTTRTRGSLMSASSRGAGSRPTASGCSSASRSRPSSSSAGGPFRSGKREDEGRALAQAAPHLDGSAVLFDDSIDESEADATSLRFRREERLEYVGQVGLRDALARIGDGDLEAPSALPERLGSHSELTPIRHRLDRVETEVPHRLP